MRQWLVIFFLLVVNLSFAWAQDEAPTAPGTTPAPPATGEKAPAQPVELISPVDGGPVQGWRIEAFSTGGVDTDFCYLNASASYYQRLIATDPRTGYTGYPEDFAPNLREPLSAKVIARIKKELPKKYDLALLEPWDRYEILAQIYIWRGMPAKDIANAYLRATYTMRGLELSEDQRDRENELRREAIRHLERAMDDAQFTLPEIPQVKYLIGELYRRSGDFKKALRYFKDAGKLKNRPEWLDEWIIRQTARAHAYDAS